MIPDNSCLFDLPAQYPSGSSCFLPQPPPLPMHHHRFAFHYPQPSRSHPPQSSLFQGAFAPSTWTNAGPSYPPTSLWHPGPPDFLPPVQHYAARSYDGPGYSLSRSDTSSADSRDSDLSPAPQVAEVVCNAPLVAPIPLPYHSPTFLLYDLPDEDEDLSHPPYTHRPHKRKRALDEEEDFQHEVHSVPAKRRSLSDGVKQWDSPRDQWSNTAAPVAPMAALRHPAAGFSRRNRAR